MTLEERRGYLTLLVVAVQPNPVRYHINEPMVITSLMIHDRLLLRRPDGLTEWHRSVLASQGSHNQSHKDRNYRRQLSEYGTFQNLSRGRSSNENAPIINPHFSES